MPEEKEDMEDIQLAGCALNKQSWISNGQRRNIGNGQRHGESFEWPGWRYNYDMTGVLELCICCQLMLLSLSVLHLPKYATCLYKYWRHRMGYVPALSSNDDDVTFAYQMVGSDFGSCLIWLHSVCIGHPTTPPPETNMLIRRELCADSTERVIDTWTDVQLIPI